MNEFFHPRPLLHTHEATWFLTLTRTSRTCSAVVHSGLTAALFSVLGMNKVSVVWLNLWEKKKIKNRSALIRPNLTPHLLTTISGQIVDVMWKLLHLLTGLWDSLQGWMGFEKELIIGVRWGFQNRAALTWSWSQSRLNRQKVPLKVLKQAEATKRALRGDAWSSRYPGTSWRTTCLSCCWLNAKSGLWMWHWGGYKRTQPAY